jgi:hypothetical protein
MKTLILFVSVFICSCGYSQKDFLWDRLELTHPESEINYVALEASDHQDFIYEILLQDLSENTDDYTDEEILDILSYGLDSE